MKTDDPKKIVIKVATQEQHDNLRNQRKTLKTLQESVHDKENIHSRALHDKDKNLIEIEKSDSKRKRVSVQNKAVQTGESTVTADDLISDEPSADYWKCLAEKRGEALNDSLQENEKLKEKVDKLLNENRIYVEMLDESRNLVEVLQQEMLGDADTTTEIGQEAIEES